MSDALPFQLYREMTALRHIKRFQQHGCAHPMSVAEHSFYVGMLAWQFAQEVFTQKIAQVAPHIVLPHALYHDVEEAITSDLPHQVKRSTPALAAAWEEVETNAKRDIGRLLTFPPTELRREEECIIKLADWAELVLYVCEERYAGNTNITPAALVIMQHLTRLAAEMPASPFQEWYAAKVDDLRTALIASGGDPRLPHRPLMFPDFE